MKTHKFLISMVVVISILTLVVIGGCKKESGSSVGGSSSTVQAKEIYYCTMHPDQTSDKPGNCPVCGMALIKKAAEQSAAQIEQRYCPVMTDMKIDPEVFTEYKGKKVYFCCTDCKAKFEADPEKYISKLPQFQN